MEKPEYPTLFFQTPLEFEKWLHANHSNVNGVWLQFYKKGSGVKTLVYKEALEVALCYGWIDSQVKSLDEKSYLQKFTPRRSKSIWSKINTLHIQRLIDEGKMKPAGLAAVETAKKDGRWQAAYDSPTEMVVPDDFLKEIKQNKKAYEFFNTLNKSNTYAVAWRLHHAKRQETRDRLIKEFVALFESGKKIHE
jgi:uncharacterized protein YdeI (YjbR/CyaY-like superfamily)